MLLIVVSFSLMAQVDEYQEYLNSLRKEQETFVKNTNKNISEMQKEYQKFVTEANAEYASFMKKDWELYENFKTQPVIPVVWNAKQDLVRWDNTQSIFQNRANIR